MIRHLCSLRPAPAGCSHAAAPVADGRPAQAGKALARARTQCPEPAGIAGVERLPAPVPAAVAR
ncbi:hypothetical protein ACFU7Y_22045 [Kitasatospora sp. NPDC057542]|uniref:hypothetical protein n=1 Tax=Kitasatospora sp. NPDC057542 TaxID=3346162 RepID=UPI0036A82E97